MKVEVRIVMYGSWDAGTWAWMMVAMLLFVGALIVAIVAIVRATDRDQRPSRRQRSATALEVLDERFARGEIDRDEYAERRRVLTE
jgi:putative membrane protein